MAVQPPRFFVPSGEGSDAAARPLVHAVARFRTEGPSAQPAEWLIVADDHGIPHRSRPDRRALLPAKVQLEVAHHELLGEPWALDAGTLWLMGLEDIEPGPDLQGLNDPVHLIGTLVGPIPSDAPEAIRGRLTVTRGDVLEAMIRGAAQPFHGAASTLESGRWISLVLPGEGEDEIDKGRGLVLAIPMSKTELELGAVGNEALVHQMLGELLSALRDDALRAEPTHPITKLPIPGLRSPAKRRSLLKKLFVESAPQAPVDDSLPAQLRVARRALDLLAGWPTARAEAIAERFRLDAASWTASAAVGTWPVLLELPIEDSALTLKRGKKSAALSVPFELDASFRAWNRGAIEVAVELRDTQGRVAIEVDAPGGAERSETVTLGGTGTWRREVFAIPRARSPKSGYRVLFDGPTLSIRQVEVRPVGGPKRPVAPPSPPPAPPPPPARIAAPRRPTPRAKPVEVSVKLAERVMLFDSTLSPDWVHGVELLPEAGTRFGFQTLRADVLGRWMDQSAAGTVCILPGCVPEAIAAGVLRRYLTRGGRVVWIGEVFPNQESVLGLGPVGAAIKTTPIITDEGLAWGLTVPDAALRPQSAKEVSVVLSRAEGRFAGSWLKNFDPTRPNSGFVRLRGGVFRCSDEALVGDLFRVATYRLGAQT